MSNGEEEDRDRGGARQRRTLRPLGPQTLDELALSYVARFATSRARLRQYLIRKLRERGWEGDRAPDVEALVEKLSRQGFVDDRAFAEAKAGSLTRRGYGLRRVGAALSVAGIDEEDRAPAMATAEAKRLDAALRFAERKRIGPFARQAMERDERERALGAMIRAGHGFDLARRIVEAAPGDEVEMD